MIHRKITSQLFSALETFPVVGLVGPRQCGKTTLARELSITDKRLLYIDLELPSDLAKLSDAEFFLSQFSDRLIILDEVQRRPDLFPLIRALVDMDRRNGRFLLLGSASPDLARQSAESLAGRIVYSELTPFLIDEVSTEGEHIQKLWSRGGYPLSFLAQTDVLSLSWRQAFITSYLERDIPQLGIKIPGATLRRFWVMMAHNHSELWNASRIAASLGISPPTARHYLDILEDTFMIRQLKPWHSNAGKRLVKSPKIYFRDSGTLHALQNIQEYESLLSHPLAGASFEGFVIEQIAAIVPPTWELFFYRTFSGAEIDLLILPPDRSPIAIEIKLSHSPSVSRGYHEAFVDSGCGKGFIVYPGSEQWSVTKDVTAVPLSRLNVLLD